METSGELRAFLTSATQEGVWGRLLDRGAAWSIMRQAGVLPEDAPLLGEDIDIDLAEHGFSILRAALALRELDGTSELCQRAFERAGNAFESLVRNGVPDGGPGRGHVYEPDLLRRTQRSRAVRLPDRTSGASCGS